VAYAFHQEDVARGVLHKGCPHAPAAANAAQPIPFRLVITHLIDAVLFHQGANGMMMKCISREEGIELLKDVHKGVCGSHSFWRLIIGKAFRHGFY
jgi:hypothetical protein